MTERSIHFVKTFVALVVLVALALLIFFAVRNARRAPQEFLTPEQRQAVIDRLNKKALENPPTQEQRDNLVQILNTANTSNTAQ